MILQINGLTKSKEKLSNLKLVKRKGSEMVRDTLCNVEDLKETIDFNESEVKNKMERNKTRSGFRLTFHSLTFCCT